MNTENKMLKFAYFPLDIRVWFYRRYQALSLEVVNYSFFFAEAD